MIYSTCKHIDCENNEFIQVNSSSRSQKLPIDSSGYCLFHSSDNEWQRNNNFKEAFFERIRMFSNKNQGLSSTKWRFNFQGFRFPEGISLEIDSWNFKSNLDLTNCKIKSELRFTDCNIRSIEIIGCSFEDNLRFKNTTIRNGIYSKSVIYGGSFEFIDSVLEGNSYFIDCDFNSSAFEHRFLIKGCNRIEYISFENSSFTPSTSIVKSTLSKELKFIHCEINNEFIFDDNIVKDSINFSKSHFTITENVNPMYSSTQFENITLEETGRLSFRGKVKQENVVVNELSISFKSPPLGQIFFENFNLNKVYHKSRKRLFALEKQGVVEIGSGCRKYSCQTDIFTIETNNASQELILSLTKIFCDYFQLSENKSLGIEIVERSRNLIKYFFFTEDDISLEEFLDRLKSNEYEMWNTFAKLTTYNNSLVKDLRIQLLLNDISAFFLKLGTLANHKSSKLDDVASVLDSIATELDSDNKFNKGKTILNIKELLSAVKEKSKDFLKTDNEFIFIENTINMKVVNNFNKKVGQVINAEHFFETPNKTPQEKQKVINELMRIKDETDKKKKKNKLSKFMDDWSGLISKAGLKLVEGLFKE
ncbi:MAG: hypothetical protein HEP71_10165 [Roseivirga sp.]|nr:hypothetical protein [Roseivirga sp.]